MKKKELKEKLEVIKEASFELDAIDEAYVLADGEHIDLADGLHFAAVALTWAKLLFEGADLPTDPDDVVDGIVSVYCDLYLGE